MGNEADIRYREKYLNLLDELDAKEKQWAEMDQRLRRILAHLLILSEGPGSPEISAELVRIRDHLKGGLSFEELEQFVEALKERVLRETRWAEEAAGLPPLHQILIHVVERLPLPPELAERALEVIATLEAGVTPDGLPDAIDAVTDLVFQVRTRMQQEKRELEALLREVTGGLQELAEGLTGAHEEADRGFAASRALEAAMHADVERLEATSREAADLESLRAAVRSTIGSVRGRLAAQREAEDAREQKLRDEVDRLRGSLKALEDEVAEHREKVRQARELSLRDPLTGCFNRLAYQERIQSELARAQRYPSPLSLIVFDLDHFKTINDTFGHKAGDQVLRAVAQIAGNQIRQVDFFGRYGGEEFVALLPETPLTAAVTVGEKVRLAIEGFRFHSRGRRVVITVSCGVAERREGDTAGTLFERADKALYRAKGQGRNRCVAEGDSAPG